MSVKLHDMSTLVDLEARTRARRSLPSPAMRRALREDAGASLAEVASAVGVTRQAVSMWELGERDPNGQNLERYVLDAHFARV